MKMTRDRVRLQRKALDAGGLMTYIQDISQHASELTLRSKRAKDGQSDACVASLDTLADQLLRGELAAVQLRYRRDGESYCDTLMTATNGYRLVSMKEP
ncbi:MAG: hypothetical protein HY698_11090 [Deltaproteobacteria bacterium]|nr:hypothetical protein [Deltaproteobacteria bacterium]